MTTCTGITYYEQGFFTSPPRASGAISTTLDHMSPDAREKFAIGDRISVTIEKVAHGGHCIARHNGAVFFVRHAIPGERCTIEVTSVGSSFNRADTVSVEIPSEHRVQPACLAAHPKGCGGCDFQHIDSAYQRVLKSQVIAEQFSRIAKMVISVEVEEVGDALGWRTRATAVTNARGEIGFYQARSHDIALISDCPIMVPEMQFSEIAHTNVGAGKRIEISLSSTGEKTLAVGDRAEKSSARVVMGKDIAHYRVGNRILEVGYKSFWQSHKNAPALLAKVVGEFAQVKSGDRILDVYGGVGLFTAALCEDVGPEGSIAIIEGSKSATADARRNFAEMPHVSVHTGDVAQLLPRFNEADIVILDPPREGAGSAVVQSSVRLRPRAIIYVSCDPASLARDTATLMASGYALKALRAFDLFPMTHHIECVALFTPDKVS